MQFFAFNLENFTPDRFFYTGTARGARDKYEVCNSTNNTDGWIMEAIGDADESFP